MIASNELPHTPHVGDHDHILDHSEKYYKPSITVISSRDNNLEENDDTDENQNENQNDNENDILHKTENMNESIVTNKNDNKKEDINEKDNEKFLERIKIESISKKSKVEN